MTSGSRKNFTKRIAPKIGYKWAPGELEAMLRNGTIDPRSVTLRQLVQAFPSVSVSLMDGKTPIRTVGPIFEEGTNGGRLFARFGSGPAPGIDVSLHRPGVKEKQGKPRVGLILEDFARALWLVCEVGQHGIEKYVPSGWLTVPDALAEYKDAKGRHLLKGPIEKLDPETGRLHLAHEVWCGLALLELMCRDEEKQRGRANNSVAETDQRPEDVGIRGRPGCADVGVRIRDGAGHVIAPKRTPRTRGASNRKRRNRVKRR